MLATFADAIARNKLFWKIYYYLLWKPATAVRKSREKYLHEEILKRFQSDQSSVKVLSGPFQDLQYPVPESHCSTLLPKLLGTYEAELQSTLLAWKGKNFPVIIDIGCAEGYYAVGLACMFPNASVFAYDIAEKARSLTQEMAIANSVHTRVTLREACERQDLLDMDLESGGLIFSDCEGYELQLFDCQVAEHLRNCHLIIEMHDRPHKNFFVTPKLKHIFSNTHNVEILNSIDDDQKIKVYSSLLISDYDDLERKAAFSERRPRIMYWLVAQPKSLA